MTKNWHEVGGHEMSNPLETVQFPPMNQPSEYFPIEWESTPFFDFEAASCDDEDSAQLNWDTPNEYIPATDTTIPESDQIHFPSFHDAEQNSGSYVTGEPGPAYPHSLHATACDPSIHQMHSSFDNTWTEPEHGTSQWTQEPGLYATLAGYDAQMPSQNGMTSTDDPNLPVPLYPPLTDPPVLNIEEQILQIVPPAYNHSVDPRYLSLDSGVSESLSNTNLPWPQTGEVFLPAQSLTAGVETLATALPYATAISQDRSNVPMMQSQLDRQPTDTTLVRSLRTRPHIRQSDEHSRLWSGSVSITRVEIGAGMNAGRNMLACFDGDMEPRTVCEIIVKRGRRGKDANHHFPDASVTLPAMLTLHFICNQFPNHVWGTLLRVFHAERWDAERIWRVLPPICRHNTSKIRPWNYLQQAIGREIDKMCEEETGLKRIPLKRKRENGDHDDDERGGRAQRMQSRIERAIPSPNLGLWRPNYHNQNVDYSRAAITRVNQPRPQQTAATMPPRPTNVNPPFSTSLLQGSAPLAHGLHHPNTADALASPFDIALTNTKADIVTELRRHKKLLCDLQASHNLNFPMLSAEAKSKVVNDLWRQRYNQWHKCMCAVFGLQIPLLMRSNPKPILTAIYAQTNQAPPHPDYAVVYQEWRRSEMMDSCHRWLHILREWTVEWTNVLACQSPIESWPTFAASELESWTDDAGSLEESISQFSGSEVHQQVEFSDQPDGMSISVDDRLAGTTHTDVSLPAFPIQSEIHGETESRFGNGEGIVESIEINEDEDNGMVNEESSEVPGMDLLVLSNSPQELVAAADQMQHPEMGLTIAKPRFDDVMERSHDIRIYEAWYRSLRNIPLDVQVMEEEILFWKNHGAAADMARYQDGLRQQRLLKKRKSSQGGQGATHSAN